MEYFCRLSATSIKVLTVLLLVSCSSKPKVNKNPEEEANLQKKAAQVIAAGPSESAKAGGYDAIPFWQNRAAVASKYTHHVLEPKNFAHSKKMYIMDFKVKFQRLYKLNESGGLSFLDKMAESSRTTYGTNERRTVMGEVALDDTEAQKITDAMFADFKKRMTALGYQLIDRDTIAYSDLKEHLAGDKMIASPQDGENFTRVYAPTGWKLEKSTYDTASLSSAFGETLMKLGEQISRKIDDGIAIAPTYIVTLGGGKAGEFQPYVGIRGSFSSAVKYYGGGFEMNEKPIQLASPYKFTQHQKEVNANNAGKLFAAVTAFATQKSQEYSTSEIQEIKPEYATLNPKIMEAYGHFSDIADEQIRQGRD